MDALIETFHLDVKLIIAQIINFAVVLGVLWFFALKPLVKIMTERSAKIEKSLAQAKEIEEKIAQSDADRQSVLRQAKEESRQLLEQTRVEAESQKQEILSKTKVEVEKLVKQGKEQLAGEKVKIVTAAQGELAALVVAATKKVLGSALTKEVDKKVVEEALKEIK